MRASRLCVGLLFFVLAGCSASLDVPETARIVCASDSECPDDYRCIAAFGRCASTDDVTPPDLVRAESPNPETVVLVFSEPLDKETARAIADYHFAPALAVESATPSPDGLTVRLLTAPQIGGFVYTATADVYDEDGNHSDPALGREFTACCSAADTTAPAILSPRNGQRILAASTTISWTARRGAHGYTIRASIDPLFVAPEFAATVGPDVTNLTFDPPVADSYYIEVVADVTLAPPERVRVAFVEDALRVYCAPTEDCTAAVNANAGGTVHDPFRSVKLAVGAAVTAGLKRIEIAGRGGGLAYDEPLIITAAVDLLGGYAPDFSPMTRDSETFVTTVDDQGASHRFTGITEPTLVQGLHIVNRVVVQPGILPQPTVLQLTRCSDALVFDDCHIEGAVAANTASLDIVVLAQSSVGAGPTIQDSTITMAGDEPTGGILLSFGDGKVTFDGCTITMRGRVRSAGSGPATVRNSVFNVEWLEAAGIAGHAVTSGVLENSRVVFREPGSGAAALVVTGASVVRNNIIIAANAGGIQLYSGAGTPLIAHNTVVVSSGSFAAILLGGDPAIVIDNLLACVEVTPSSIGTNVTGVRPLSYDANAVVGCAFAYRDAGGVAQDANVRNGASCGTDCSSQFRGNPARVADITGVFADLDGADDDLASLEDSDLHLGTNATAMSFHTAGRDTSASNCGNAEAPRSCGNITTDYDGDPRSAPVSIGADE